MLKHLLIPIVLGLAIAAGGTDAATAETETPALAPVVARLEAEGYQVIDAHLSWLGRLVVVSSRDGMLREVVLNRTTGTVLSDRLFEQPEAKAASGTSERTGDGTRSGGTGSGGTRSGGSENDDSRNGESRDSGKKNAH